MILKSLKNCLPDSDRPVPGSSLMKVPPILAAAVMIFNLVYLKAKHPGWWSGKLSDFAICFLLPVLIISIWEWILFLTGRKLPAGLISITVACLMTATYFSLLQLYPPAGEFHVSMLGKLVKSYRFAVTPDPSDLIALPFTVLSFFWLRKEMHKSLCLNCKKNDKPDRN